MMTYFVGYLALLVTFVAADMVWLGTMTSRVYRPTLGDVLISGVNLAPAVVFYALYPIGLMIFVLLPALKNGSVGTAAFYGALFGFFTYSTYDLTNYATVRNWTLQLTLIDIAWGSVLAAVAAAVSFMAASRFGGG